MSSPKYLPCLRLASHIVLREPGAKFKWEHQDRPGGFRIPKRVRTCSATALWRLGHFRCVSPLGDDSLRNRVCGTDFPSAGLKLKVMPAPITFAPSNACPEVPVHAPYSAHASAHEESLESRRSKPSDPRTSVAATNTGSDANPSSGSIGIRHRCCKGVRSTYRAFNPRLGSNEVARKGASWVTSSVRNVLPPWLEIMGFAVQNKRRAPFGIIRDELSFGLSEGLHLFPVALNPDGADNRLALRPI